MSKLTLSDLPDIRSDSLWAETGPQGPPGQSIVGPRGANGDKGDKGDDGKPGAGFAMRGNWQARFEYAPGDIVRHDGALWAVAEPSKGRTPRPNSTFWRLLIKDGERGERGEQGTAGQRGRSVRVEVDGNRNAGFFDSAAVRGNVVYISGNGHVDLAQADSESTAFAIGLATAARQPGDYGEYVTGGAFTCDAWNWTPGEMVYLSPSVAGGLTQDTSIAAGQLVTYVGMASTPTEIIIEIERGILIAQEPEE